MPVLAVIAVAHLVVVANVAHVVFACLDDRDIRLAEVFPTGGHLCRIFILRSYCVERWGQYRRSDSNLKSWVPSMSSPTQYFATTSFKSPLSRLY